MNNKHSEERGNWIQQLITNNFIICNQKLEKSDYQSIMTNFKNKLIFIERSNENQDSDNYIPCLFYRNPKSSNFLIYFHGNSEHIFQIDFYGLDFRSYLEMNVIIVEYPGYSISMDEQNSDPNKIFTDSLIVYDWVQKQFKISEEQIFVCGRSLGTSPSIYLSSKKKPKGLFLISAFTSIKDIGADMHLSIFLEKIFKSYEYIKEVKCPILLIHGEKDSLISYKHSIKLKNEIQKNNNNVELIIRPNMTHNDFVLKDDIIFPIKNFIEKKKLISKKINSNVFQESKTSELYKIPNSIRTKIESKIFDISEFECYPKIVKKDAKYLIWLFDGRFALINGSKISIYNEKKYILDYEIELNKINRNDFEITYLFQMKNKNLACSTNKGEIFILKIEDEEYEEIKNLSLKEEVYKICEFNESLISILSKNHITILDCNSFKEVFSFQIQELFTDFVIFPVNRLALLKPNALYLGTIDESGINIYQKFNLKINGKPYTLAQTNKFLLVGGINKIHYLDYSLNNNEPESIEISKKKEEIIYIHKIHDELLLASTDSGAIIQIIFDGNKKPKIIMKYCINDDIFSLLFKNYKTILFTSKDQIQVLSTNKKDNDNNCLLM